MTALVFMDTETTGLSLDDDIWEFAAIRREEDGRETEHHMFIQHDEKKCRALPDSFFKDHEARYDHRTAVPRWVAARDIADITDKAHIVGAVPNFDTERIAILVRAFGIWPSWHYHLIDVENLAVGYLHGRADENPGGGISGAVILPWSSDDLSRAVGVVPPGEGERHTAMGDARWARALYDAICGGAS